VRRGRGSRVRNGLAAGGSEIRTLGPTEEERPLRSASDGQSVDAQVRQLTKAGCKKVFREVASGAKTDRAQLRRLLDMLDAGDVLTVTRLDRLARSTRGPAEHTRGGHRQESRFQIPWRHMGRHDDIARSFDANRPRRAGGI
jgi:hypothetical protein